MTAGRTQANNAARCAGWRAITYSGERDTLETIGQIRVHNQVGRNKRCWK